MTRLTNHIDMYRVQVDVLGWTPLHVACSVGASVDTIALLVGAYSDAAVLRTEKGSLALGKFERNLVLEWLASPSKIISYLVLAHSFITQHQRCCQLSVQTGWTFNVS